MLKWKRFTTFCMLMLLIILAYPTNSQAATSDKNKVVNVPDPQLKSYLKGELGVKTLTRGAMLKVKKLNYSVASDNSRKPLTSLEGLQYAKNLKLVTIKGNQVTNYKPLAKLAKLTYLNINENSSGSKTVTSLKYIVDIPNLETLYARGNKISNIEGLEKLTKLKDISLENNRIDQEDIDQLFNYKVIKYNKVTILQRLNYFNISYNNIKDVQKLLKLPNIKQLLTVGNHVNNFSHPDTPDTKINYKNQYVVTTMNIKSKGRKDSWYGQLNNPVRVESGIFMRMFGTAKTSQVLVDIPDFLTTQDPLNSYDLVYGTRGKAKLYQETIKGDKFALLRFTDIGDNINTIVLTSYNYESFKLIIHLNRM